MKFTTFYYEKYWKKRETVVFNRWFEKEYGCIEEYNQDNGEVEEYYVRKSFALMGWIGHLEFVYKRTNYSIY